VMANSEEEIAVKLQRLLLPRATDGTNAALIVESLLAAACGIAVASGIDSGELDFALETKAESESQR